MSVYTTVSLKEARTWGTHHYKIVITNIQAIPTGTVNSNYYIDTQNQRFILTIFETLPPKHINDILTLTDFMAQEGLPCPKPIHNKNNQWISQIANKPAALIECLPGQSLTHPNIFQCVAISQFLAKMHIITQCYPLQLQDTMGTNFRDTMLRKLHAHLPAKAQQLAKQTADIIQTLPFSQLPQGIIHADLFCDNTLFLHGKLTGVIDFYFACQGVFIYDLAILINDWCFDGYQFIPPKYQACLTGYQSIRALSEDELRLLPKMLLLATFRFWLSRLDDFYFPKQGKIVQTKDPQEMQMKLEYHLQHFALSQDNLRDSR